MPNPKFRHNYCYYADYLVPRMNAAARQSAVSHANDTQVSQTELKMGELKMEELQMEDLQMDTVPHLMDHLVDLFHFNEGDGLKQFYAEIAQLHQADESQRASWSPGQHINYGLSRMMALNHQYIKQFVYVDIYIYICVCMHVSHASILYDSATETAHQLVIQARRKDQRLQYKINHMVLAAVFDEFEYFWRYVAARISAECRTSLKGMSLAHDCCASAELHGKFSRLRLQLHVHGRCQPGMSLLQAQSEYFVQAWPKNMELRHTQVYYPVLHANRHHFDKEWLDALHGGEYKVMLRDLFVGDSKSPQKQQLRMIFPGLVARATLAMHCAWTVVREYLPALQGLPDMQFLSLSQLWAGFRFIIGAWPDMFQLVCRPYKFISGAVAVDPHEFGLGCFFEGWNRVMMSNDRSRFYSTSKIVTNSCPIAEYGLVAGSNKFGLPKYIDHPCLLQKLFCRLDMKQDEDHPVDCYTPLGCLFIAALFQHHRSLVLSMYGNACFVGQNDFASASVNEKTVVDGVQSIMKDHITGTPVVSEEDMQAVQETLDHLGTITFGITPKDRCVGYTKFFRVRSEMGMYVCICVCVRVCMCVYVLYPCAALASTVDANAWCVHRRMVQQFVVFDWSRFVACKQTTGG